MKKTLLGLSFVLISFGVFAFELDWMIVGPFPNPHKVDRAQGESEGFKNAYGPEKKVDLNAVYNEMGKLIWWRYLPPLSSKEIFDLDSLFSPNEKVIAYAYTEIYSPDEREVSISAGSDDSIKIWLNGKLILSHFTVGRGPEPDQHLIKTRLNSGWNKVLLKIEDNVGGWSFYFNLAPNDGLKSDATRQQAKMMVLGEENGDLRRETRLLGLKDPLEIEKSPEINKILGSEDLSQYRLIAVGEADLDESSKNALKKYIEQGGKLLFIEKAIKGFTQGPNCEIGGKNNCARILFGSQAKPLKESQIQCNLYPQLSAATSSLDFPVFSPPRETPLVADGKALGAIVYSAKNQKHQSLAKNLADAIKRATGVDFPIIPDNKVVTEWCGPLPKEYQQKPLILIGDINSNRAILPLYAKYLCWSDANYPGEGGYVMRTVVSPYFYRGPNHIIIDGGGEDAMSKAISEFRNLIAQNGKKGALAVPGLLKLKLSDKWAWYQKNAKKAAKRQVEVNQSYNSKIALRSKLYQVTGELPCAETVREAFLRALKKYPEGIKAGSDYSLEALARAWELSRDSGVYTPKEVQTINQALYKGLHKSKTMYWRWDGPKGDLGTRHSAAGSYAFMVMAEVLRRQCPDDTPTAQQLDIWIKGVHNYFDAFDKFKNFRGKLDNNESIQVTGLLLSYALREGKLAVFKSGLAREACKHAMSLVDSMGYRAGQQMYEDTYVGSVRGGQLVGEVLAIAGFYYHDPQLKWFCKNFPGCGFYTWFAHGTGIEHAFASGDSVTIEKPEKGFYSGVVAVPALHDRYLFSRDQGRTELPYEYCFEKLALRDGLTPMDKFLVIQGMEPRRNWLGDANTIIRMSDQGRVCLFHNNKWRSRFHRNGVLVSSGFSRMPPRAAWLNETAEFISTNFCQTTLPDYRGTDWTRTILSLKNSITLVFDDIEAKTPDHFSATCVWRTPAVSSIKGRDWFSSLHGVEFHIVSSAQLRDDIELEPMIPGEIGFRGTGLRQIQYSDLASGQKITFRNLLYTNGRKRPAKWDIRRLNADAVLAKNSAGEIHLAGINGLRSKEVATDAAIFMFGPGKICLARATFLKIKGKTVWTKKSPENVELASAEVLKDIDLASFWDAGSNPDLRPALILAEKAKGDQASEPLKRLWTFEDFKRKLNPISGVEIIEPKNKNRSWRHMFDGEPGRACASGVKIDKNAEMTLDLGAVKKIGGLRIWLNSVALCMLKGENPAWPPKIGQAKKVKVAVSDSMEFDKVKFHEIDLKPALAFRELYKSESHACRILETLGLELSGRYIALRFSNPKPFSIHEMEILENIPAPLEFIDATKVKSKNGENLAVATDSGEIIEISADGKKIRSKQYPGFLPIDLAAFDVADDDSDEIMFSSGDGGLHILFNDDREEWRAPKSAKHCELRYKIVPGLVKSNGKRSILSSSYYHVFEDSPGEPQIIEHAGNSIMWGYDLLPPLYNFDGKNGNDLIIKSIYGNSSFLDSKPLKTTKRYHGNFSLFGRSMYWTYVNTPKSKNPDLLMVAANGIGFYQVTNTPGLKGIWEKSDDVRQFCGLLIDNSKNEKRLLVGRSDSFIAEFNLKGELIANHWMGWPVKSIVQADGASGKKYVIVATDGGVYCFDDAWKALQFIPGACRQLLKIKNGDDEIIAALLSSGQIIGFKL